MSQKDVLVSLNGKAFENADFLPVLQVLNKKFRSVILVNPEELDPRLSWDQIEMWVVAGGDGTLNAAANALLKDKQTSRVPVCYIPSGTGNDFARTLGLLDLTPSEIMQQALETKSFKEIAVGFCNDQAFANVATGGLFATITPDADPKVKSVLGRWSYLLSGLEKIKDRQSFQVRLGEEPAMSALGFFVGNAPYAGGGVQVAPEADPFSDTLEFLLIPDLPTTELMGLGLEMQKEQPDLSGFSVVQKKVTELHLKFETEVPINLDGEQIKTKSARLTILPRAMRIYAP